MLSIQILFLISRMSTTRKVHHFSRSLPYNSSKGCPSGYHKRSGYKSASGAYIPPRCVKATTRYAESSKQFKNSVGDVLRGFHSFSSFSQKSAFFGNDQRGLVGLCVGDRRSNVGDRRLVVGDRRVSVGDRRFATKVIHIST